MAEINAIPNSKQEPTSVEYTQKVLPSVCESKEQNWVFLLLICADFNTPDTRDLSDPKGLMFKVPGFDVSKRKI